MIKPGDRTPVIHSIGGVADAGVIHGDDLAGRDGVSVRTFLYLIIR